MNEKELIETVHVLIQPTKYKIIKAIAEAKRPLYIGEIAKRIKEDRREVSFHLAALAEYGLVDGEYRVILERGPARGKAGKFYKLTKKTEYVLSKFSEELDKLVEVVKEMLKRESWG